MMGLLDSFANDPAKAYGLLNLGLSLLQSRGSLAPALGRAGQAGLLGAQFYRNQEGRQAQTAIENQLLQGRLQDMQRQRQMQALPGRFFKPPSAPTVDATGGMDTAGENQANASGPGGFDMPAYTQALMAFDPVQSLQLQQALKKQVPAPIKLGEGDQLLDPATFKPIAKNPKAVRTPEPPNAVQEYEYARAGGYKGSFPQWVTEKARAGASNVVNKTEVKTGESLGAQVGPMVRESRGKAIDGIKLVDSADRILKAADRGQLYSGPLANVQLKVAQWGESLGIAGKDTAERIKNTRSVIRGMAEQAVAARSQLGGQAQISNAEQELLTKATAGDIGDLTHAEVVQIAQLNDRLGRQLYGLHAEQLKALEGDPSLRSLGRFYSVPPLPQPAAPAASGVPDMSAIDAEIARRRGGR